MNMPYNDQHNEERYYDEISPPLKKRKLSLPQGGTTNGQFQSSSTSNNNNNNNNNNNTSVSHVKEESQSSSYEFPSEPMQHLFQLNHNHLESFSEMSGAEKKGNSVSMFMNSPNIFSPSGLPTPVLSPPKFSSGNGLSTPSPLFKSPNSFMNSSPSFFGATPKETVVLPSMSPDIQVNGASHTTLNHIAGMTKLPSPKEIIDDRGRMDALKPLPFQALTLQQMQMNVPPQQPWPHQSNQQQQQQQMMNASMIKSESQEIPQGKDVGRKMMELTRGFIIAPHAKQIGGKDNREPIPEHVVTVYSRNIPPNYHNQITKMHIVAELIGYKKPMLMKDKVVLSTLQRLPVVNPPAKNAPQMQVDEVITLRFGNLIVKHSSHNHGQKLLVRFSLIAADGKTLSFIESAEFETITRRGIEKQRQKEMIIKKKIEEENNTLPPPQVLRVEPAVSTLEGGTLVKIHVQYLPSNIQIYSTSGSDEALSPGEGSVPKPLTKTPNIVVYFGTQECREIFCARNDLIVCEVPPALNTTAGEVPVNISLDGRKSCLPSQATMTYLGHDALYNFVQSNQRLSDAMRSDVPKRIHSDHIHVALSMYHQHMLNGAASSTNQDGKMMNTLAFETKPNGHMVME